MPPGSITGPVAARHDGVMRRLLPDPADDVTVVEAYATSLGRHADRPWLGLCMVASIDGSTVVGGNSGRLSSATDGAVLAQLRQLADVILVGATTVRHEGYGPPRKPGQRIGVVTNSGSIDFTSELFTTGAGFVVTSEDSDFAIPDDVEVVRAGHKHVEFDQIIERLGVLIPGCKVVQAEGGASLNGALLDAGVIDEINLTTSPATFGGDGPRLAVGAQARTARFDVAQLAIDDESFVYTRWLRRG